MTAHMQTPWEVLQAARKDSGIRLQPPLSQDELAQVETEAGRKLPADLHELLLLCGGFESPAGTVDFGGRDMSLATPFASIPVLADGNGNFWIVDLEPDQHTGPVMFWCHDPAVMVIQAPTLSEFLQQIIDVGRDTDRLAFIRKQRSHEIWASDPYLVPVEEARQSADPDLAAFAQELADSFFIADLRKCEIGSGFSWGKSDSDVRRLKDKLIFGVEKKTKKSLFGSLFKKKQN